MRNKDSNMEEQIQTTAPKAANIYAALIKAQSEFTVIRKTKAAKDKTGRIMYMYADLEDVLNAVRPALNKYGLLLTQDINCDGDNACITTTIASADGNVLTSGTTRIPAVPGVGMNKAQAFGSAISYGRRYSLCAFLGISSDDDDDGRGAGQASSSQPEQAPAARSGFKLTQAMINDATMIAESGSAIYQKYFNAQTKEWRIAMASTGNHARLKAIALEADKEAANE